VVLRCCSVVGCWLAGQATSAAESSKPLKSFSSPPIQHGRAGGRDLEGKDYNQGEARSMLMRDRPRRRCSSISRRAGKWMVRSDVWVRYQREHGPLLAAARIVSRLWRSTSLRAGTPVRSRHRRPLRESSAADQNSLGRKESLQRFPSAVIGGEVGKYYTLMIAQIREALSN